MAISDITGTNGKGGYRWTFFQAGGVDQVMLRTAADLANIPELDLKLWMTLSMPTTGLEFDPLTAQLIDTDKDGRIRPPELVAAIRWAQGAFNDLGDITKGGSKVALAAIRDPGLVSAARRVLSDLGKPDAAEITVEDVAAHAKTLGTNKLNGDGVVTPDLAEDATTRKALEDILGVMGGVMDRSGKPGLDQATVDAFFTQAEALIAWANTAETDKTKAPLGLDATLAALEAVKAVKPKLEDYFARCRLAAFDPRAVAALNREEKEYLALTAKDLTITAQEIACLPLARVGAGLPVPFDTSLNPAWSGPMSAFVAKAMPLVGAGRTALSEEDWGALQAKLAPFEALLAAKPPTKAEALGLARLRELVKGSSKAALNALIQKDLSLSGDYAQLASLDKLTRFQRDLYELITNYVNFADFYGRTWSVFQSGTLYFDARACDLCVEVTDPGKHATLASLSGAYLAYCDVTRPGGQKKTIVAVITDGDSDNLMVGRNGVFYDRKGQDWDATVTKIVANPISVREAFWMPYKKLIRFIEEQVAKRAQAAEAESLAKMSDSATKIATADQAKPAAAPPKKLELGTIALIGTAIGGISALVGGFLQALFGLGFWLPLGVAGVIMLISGPSMILAWLKLRQRNLAPILDANGWAINTKARVNVPFGASLTQLAKLPAGSTKLLDDPFAEKKRPWKSYILLLVLAGLGYAWWVGSLDGYLPQGLRHVTPSVGLSGPGGVEPAQPAPQP